MRRRSPGLGLYDPELYEAIAREVESGTPITRERVATAAVADHHTTGATAAAIARRLTKHNVLHPNNRPWTWPDIDTLLEQSRWAAFDARQAAQRQHAANGEVGT